MSALLNLTARALLRFRKHKPRAHAVNPRILVIRRNRMGDMIYTLPLLHAIRRHHPKAHITVACDPAGAPIAQACDAVNEVILLQRGGLPGLALLKNAARLQDFDWVIAAKGGFDRRLANLASLTNAAVRIGFVEHVDRPSLYTDPVALPEDPFNEHQIETLLRLLKPLGVVTVNNFAINLSLTVPESSQQQAAAVLAPIGYTPFILINISSTVRLKFGDEDFLALISQILSSTNLVVGLVAAPADQPKAASMAAQIASGRVMAMPTSGPLDLAALLQKSTCLFTPEGGAAHLAAAVGKPALILWSEGPFEKWHSRGPNHVFIHAEKGERTVPGERIWQALRPLLPQKK